MANVRVAVRVRPLSARERQDGGRIIVDMDDKQVRIRNMKVDRRVDAHVDARERLLEFTFDFCYWSLDPEGPRHASQEEIFQDLGVSVLSAAEEGYNVCLFAYGQTGSGKTYTMMGTPDSMGLTPRICQGLFRDLEPEGQSCRVEISFLEIYNERVRDLLRTADHKKPTPLKVREHPDTGPYVQGLSQHLVSDYRQAVVLLEKGIANRITAATHVHDGSSRSHAIFSIQYTQASLENGLPSEISSKINLVDLAGSERADPNFCRDRITEGANINKSLVTLGIVISALAQNSQMFSSCQSINSVTSEGEGSFAGSQSSSLSGGGRRHCFIPYRDSVLTWLLKDSLGGNSKTIMIATISPSCGSYSETASTLRYAGHARNIVNKPRVNEDANVRLIRELREEIDRLKNMLLGYKMQRNPSPSLSDERDGSFSDIVLQNELKVDQWTQDWSDGWRHKRELLEGYSVDINRDRAGFLIRSLVPHLIALEQDVLNTGVTFYHLQEGVTRIGPQQQEQEGLLTVHQTSSCCEIENHCGVVTLRPVPGHICMVNDKEVTEPSRLAQGAVITLGGRQKFRFNHPAEAALLRERRRTSEGALACRPEEPRPRNPDLGVGGASCQGCNDASPPWKHVEEHKRYVKVLREEIQVEQRRAEEDLEMEQVQLGQQQAEIKEWILKQKEQMLRTAEKDTRESGVQTVDFGAADVDCKRVVQEELLYHHALRRAESRIRRKRLRYQLDRIARKRHLLEAKRELQRLVNSLPSPEGGRDRPRVPCARRRSHSCSGDLLSRLYPQHTPIFSQFLRRNQSSDLTGFFSGPRSCVSDNRHPSRIRGRSNTLPPGYCSLSRSRKSSSESLKGTLKERTTDDKSNSLEGHTLQPKQSSPPRGQSSSQGKSCQDSNSQSTKKASLQKVLPRGVRTGPQGGNKGLEKIRKVFSRSFGPSIRTALSRVFHKPPIGLHGGRSPKVKGALGTFSSKSVKQRDNQDTISEREGRTIKATMSCDDLEWLKPTQGKARRRWRSTDALSSQTRRWVGPQGLIRWVADNQTEETGDSSDGDSLYSLDSLSSAYASALAQKLQQEEVESSESENDDSQMSQDSLVMEGSGKHSTAVMREWLHGDKIKDHRSMEQEDSAEVRTADNMPAEVYWNLCAAPKTKDPKETQEPYQSLKDTVLKTTREETLVSSPCSLSSCSVRDPEGLMFLTDAWSSTDAADSPRNTALVKLCGSSQIPSPSTVGFWDGLGSSGSEISDKSTNCSDAGAAVTSGNTTGAAGEDQENEFGEQIAEKDPSTQVIIPESVEDLIREAPSSKVTVHSEVGLKRNRESGAENDAATSLEHLPPEERTFHVGERTVKEAAVHPNTESVPPDAAEMKKDREPSFRTVGDMYLQNVSSHPTKFSNHLNCDYQKSTSVKDGQAHATSPSKALLNSREDVCVEVDGTSEGSSHCRQTLASGGFSSHQCDLYGATCKRKRIQSFQEYFGGSLKMPKRYMNSPSKFCSAGNEGQKNVENIMSSNKTNDAAGPETRVMKSHVGASIAVEQKIAEVIKEHLELSFSNGQENQETLNTFTDTDEHQHEACVECLPSNFSPASPCASSSGSPVEHSIQRLVLKKVDQSRDKMMDAQQESENPTVGYDEMKSLTGLLEASHALQRDMVKEVEITSKTSEAKPFETNNLTQTEEKGQNKEIKLASFQPVTNHLQRSQDGSAQRKSAGTVTVDVKQDLLNPFGIAMNDATTNAGEQILKQIRGEMKKCFTPVETNTGRLCSSDPQILHNKLQHLAELRWQDPGISGVSVPSVAINEMRLKNMSNKIADLATASSQDKTCSSEKQTSVESLSESPHSTSEQLLCPIMCSSYVVPNPELQASKANSKPHCVVPNPEHTKDLSEARMQDACSSSLQTNTDCSSGREPTIPLRNECEDESPVEILRSSKQVVKQVQPSIECECKDVNSEQALHTSGSKNSSSELEVCLHSDAVCEEKVNASGLRDDASDPRRKGKSKRFRRAHIIASAGSSTDSVSDLSSNESVTSRLCPSRASVQASPAAQSSGRNGNNIKKTTQVSKPNQTSDTKRPATSKLFPNLNTHLQKHQMGPSVDVRILSQMSADASNPPEDSRGSQLQNRVVQKKESSLHFASSDINPFIHSWQHSESTKNVYKNQVFGSAADISTKASPPDCTPTQITRCCSADNGLNVQDSPFNSHLRSYANHKALSSTLSSEGDFKDLRKAEEKNLASSCSGASAGNSTCGVDEIVFVYAQQESQGPGHQDVSMCDHSTQTGEVSGGLERRLRQRRSSTDQKVENRVPTTWTSLQNMSAHLSQLIHNTSDLLGNIQCMRSLELLNQSNVSCRSSSQIRKKDCATQTTIDVGIQTPDSPEIHSSPQVGVRSKPCDVNLLLKVIGSESVRVSQDDELYNRMPDLRGNITPSQLLHEGDSLNVLSQDADDDHSSAVFTRDQGCKKTPCSTFGMAAIRRCSSQVIAPESHIHLKRRVMAHVSGRQVSITDRASSPILIVEVDRRKSALSHRKPQSTKPKRHAERQHSAWDQPKNAEVQNTLSWSILQSNGVQTSSDGSEENRNNNHCTSLSAGRNEATQAMLPISQSRSRRRSSSIDNLKAPVCCPTFNSFHTSSGSLHSPKDDKQSRQPCPQVDNKINCMPHDVEHLLKVYCGIHEPSDPSQITVQHQDDDVKSVAPSECNTDVLLSINPLTGSWPVEEQPMVPEDLPIHNKFTNWSGIHQCSSGRVATCPIAPAVNGTVVQESPGEHLQQESLGSSFRPKSLLQVEKRAQEITRLRTEREHMMATLRLDLSPHQLTVELAEAKLHYGLGETDALLKVLRSSHKPETSMSSTRQQLYNRHQQSIEGLRQEREARLQTCRRTRSLSPSKRRDPAVIPGPDSRLMDAPGHGLGQLRQDVVETRRVPGHWPSEIELLLRDYGRAREEACTEIARARDRLRKRTAQEKRRLQQQALSHVLMDDVRFRSRVSSSTLCTSSSLSLSSGPTSGYNSSNAGLARDMQLSGILDAGSEVRVHPPIGVSQTRSQRPWMSVQDVRLEIPGAGSDSSFRRRTLSIGSVTSVVYQDIAAGVLTHALAEVRLASAGDTRNLLIGRSSAGWRYQRSECGVQVFHKTCSKASAHGFLCAAELDRPMADLWSVVSDHSRVQLYNPCVRCSWTRPLDQHTQLVYLLTEPAACHLKQARDFCCLSTESQTDGRWVLAMQSVYDESLPRPSASAVRAEMLPSAWVLQPSRSQGKEKVTIIYLLQVDLGPPALPQRLITAAARKQAKVISDLDALLSA
ncbi:stAR-related lipid transfer protein 9-like [Denticeps clupeoides]|uniref:stAR-related lipid transfer protein 9-like n=1 Tax=Denticeps clupeoides TaxID=299321 RepID=UPI0010A56C65|nr:stAR-related lipid transfer protein 9-like [Denticeps clupeoides]